MNEQSYKTDKLDLYQMDCMDALRDMLDNSVDAIVTDPPYGLSFMGKKWDYDVPSVEIWAECLRVLKPGAHLLAFAGTRTQHRMAVRIEDAGFEIRDMIAWVYGSGFPKSLDVSKAIDKAAGAERPRIDGPRSGGMLAVNSHNAGHGYRPNDYGENGNSLISGDPITEAARQWQGWGTALKPALEPITVARKPLIGTVAENVLEHGTGALNIDGCRVGNEVLPAQVRGVTRMRTFEGAEGNETPERIGRWPANLIHDGSDEVVGLFPHTISGGGDKHGKKASTFCASTDWQSFKGTSNGGDSGTAARFFYCAKAGKKDRGDNNIHPTVKPTDLMRYLCRLITPKNGVVLDPFMGSGSTGKAAALEGFQFIGIERDPEYYIIAKSRILTAQLTLDL